MKQRAYIKMMSRFGIIPHSRQNVKYAQINTIDPIDSKNGIQIGQRFEILEELDGAFRIRVPFRDFPYPVPASNIKLIYVRKKKMSHLKQTA